MTAEGLLVITIDGPAASGKSTVARRVAERLGLHYLDTGAMYRAVTWAALQAGLAPADGAAIAGLVESSELRLTPEGRVLWNGSDITREIRSREVASHVSTVAAHPEVRERLVHAQRRHMVPPGLVSEGRDQGSVVFPDAQVRIFLVADLAERGRRRAADLAAAGEPTSPDEVARDLERRDARDQQRRASPLRPPPGARIIDTTALTIEEVVARVIAEATGRSPSGA